jgi:hypothetical protein
MANAKSKTILVKKHHVMLTGRTATGRSAVNIAVLVASIRDSIRTLMPFSRLSLASIRIIVPLVRGRKRSAVDIAVLVASIRDAIRALMPFSRLSLASIRASIPIIVTIVTIHASMSFHRKIKVVHFVVVDVQGRRKKGKMIS